MNVYSIYTKSQAHSMYVYRMKISVCLYNEREREREVCVCVCVWSIFSKELALACDTLFIASVGEDRFARK